MTTRLLASLALLVAGACRADSWYFPPSPLVAVSESRKTVVLVVPRYEPIDHSSARHLPTAAIWLRSTPRGFVAERHALLDPHWAAQASMAGDGALALLDAWGGNLAGPVVQLYTPHGVLVRSYTLDELYSPEQLGRMDRSTKSIDWRCDEPAWDATGALHLRDALAGELVFARDGTMSYAAGLYPYCASRFRAAPAGRASLAIAGILLAIALAAMFTARPLLRVRAQETA